MTRTTALLALAVLATGCEDFQLDDVTPSVHFERLDVEHIDFQGIDAGFVFVIDNPNPVEVGVAEFSYDLDLEGESFLNGDEPDGLHLGALGESELALPLSTTWDGLWSTIQATRGEDYVDFDLAGRFGFDTPIGRVRVPYATDGDFPALRTPHFSFDKIRVTSVDLLSQEATIEVDLAVDNALGSTMFFDSVGYDLHLEGKRVATGNIAQLGGVDGATMGTLSLPVTIDLVAAGTEIADTIINRDPVSARLSADMDVDTPFGILPLAINESGRVRVR